MSKVAELKRLQKEAHDAMEHARTLYEADGNLKALWHAEDEITRLYYLRLAVQSAETKSPASRIQ